MGPQGFHSIQPGDLHKPALNLLEDHTMVLLILKRIVIAFLQLFK